MAEKPRMVLRSVRTRKIPMLNCVVVDFVFARPRSRNTVTIALSLGSGLTPEEVAKELIQHADFVAMEMLSIEEKQ